MRRVSSERIERDTTPVDCDAARGTITTGVYAGRCAGLVTDDSTVSRLGRILPILLANRGEGSIVGAVCLTAVAALDVDGAGLSLRTSEHRAPVCAYGAFASLGEELQLSLGEGPCVDAFDAGELIEIMDLTSHEGTRWPVFSRGMVDAGAASMASFPLRIGAARFGTLTLYRSTFGELSSDQVADSYVIAQLAAHLMVAEQAKIGGDLVISDIQTGFGRMEPVHQATGMIMAHLSLGAEDALARLRGAAYAAQRSAMDMAMDIVAGTVVLPRDEQHPPQGPDVTMKP